MDFPGKLWQLSKMTHTMHHVLLLTRSICSILCSGNTSLLAVAGAAELLSKQLSNQQGSETVKLASKFLCRGTGETSADRVLAVRRGPLEDNISTQKSASKHRIPGTGIPGSKAFNSLCRS